MNCDWIGFRLEKIATGPGLVDNDVFHVIVSSRLAYNNQLSPDVEKHVKSPSLESKKIKYIAVFLNLRAWKYRWTTAASNHRGVNIFFNYLHKRGGTQKINNESLFFHTVFWVLPIQTKKKGLQIYYFILPIKPNKKKSPKTFFKYRFIEEG